MVPKAFPLQSHCDTSIKPKLLAAVRDLITQARERAVSAVDTERVLMYWHVGQLIVEEEQQGADRAACGSALIEGLATVLQPQFSSGFSGRQFHWYVQFYRTFPIVTALPSQFSWTHYHKIIQLYFENSGKLRLIGQSFPCELMVDLRDTQTARFVERQ